MTDGPAPAAIQPSRIDAIADAIDGWRDFVRTKDSRLLASLLHPDIVFESPVVHTPQRGRDITIRYLIGAEMVLGGPAFRYVSEWRSATGAVLEFETEIHGVHVNGVDIITLDPDDGRIVRFKVMIRPLKAIGLVHELMGRALGSSGAAPALP